MAKCYADVPKDKEFNQGCKVMKLWRDVFILCERWHPMRSFFILYLLKSGQKFLIRINHLIHSQLMLKRPVTSQRVGRGYKRVLPGIQIQQA